MPAAPAEDWVAWDLPRDYAPLRAMPHLTRLVLHIVEDLDANMANLMSLTQVRVCVHCRAAPARPPVLQHPPALGGVLGRRRPGTAELEAYAAGDTDAKPACVLFTLLTPAPRVPPLQPCRCGSCRCWGATAPPAAWRS